MPFLSNSKVWITMYSSRNYTSPVIVPPLGNFIQESLNICLSMSRMKIVSCYSLEMRYLMSLVGIPMMASSPFLISHRASALNFRSNIFRGLTSTYIVLKIQIVSSSSNFTSFMFKISLFFAFLLFQTIREWLLTF